MKSHPNVIPTEDFFLLLKIWFKDLNMMLRVNVFEFNAPSYVYTILNLCH